MDPNDIYNLATQAGLTGQSYDDPSAMAPGTPSYADYMNSSAPPSQGFSDDDIMAHFVPQSNGPQGGIVDPFADSPAPTAPLPPLPSDVKSGEKVKAGVSASNSGYSDKKNQQVRKGPGAALDNQIAGIQAEGDAKEAERTGRVMDAAGNAGQVMEVEERDPVSGQMVKRRVLVGASGQKGAEHNEALATADLITATGHQKAILATLQQNYDAQTEKMITDETGKANEAKAKYVGALNDFRAARVNPGQLWGNMSGGDQFGMLVAAFAHDFLGAKGIKTSSMDTLNKAIDRNIDAQVNAIHNKGQVADGFKTLWDMQVADSHSMQEARTRMRGFMLDAAKTSMESYLAQFDAQLATAKGRVGIAKLDAELAKTMNEIGQHVDQNTNQRIQQAITRYGDELRASMEASRIAVEREKNRIEAAKAGLGVDKNIAELVYDNSKSGGGYANGIFKPGIKDEEKVKYREMQAGTNHLTDLMQEYRSLYSQYGNQGALGGTRWSKEQDARLRAVAAEILEARSLKYSGKAVTDKERELLKTGTPDALFSTTRSIASQLADTERRNREELNRKRETLVFDLDEGSSYRKYRSGMGGEGKTEIKEAGMVGDGSDKATSANQDAVASANKLLEKHSANAKVEGTIFEDLQNDHDRFVEAHPEDFKAKTTVKRYGKEDYNVEERDLSVKGYEAGLTKLFNVAKLAKESGDADTYVNAVGRLQAAMDPTVNGDNRLMSDYAAMKLADLNESVSDSHEAPSAPSTDVSPVDIDPRAKLPPLPNKKKK